MSRTVDWEIPGEIQPKQADCSFDLDRALNAVFGLRATSVRANLPFLCVRWCVFDSISDCSRRNKGGTDRTGRCSWEGVC